MPDQQQMMPGEPPMAEGEIGITTQEAAETDAALNTLAEQSRMLAEGNEDMSDAEEDFSVIDTFENFASKPKIVEECKKAVLQAYNDLGSRDDMEAIWKKNDLMYRVKPEADLKVKNRANESHGVFTVGINQLVSMAYKTFTDGIKKYGFEPLPHESTDLFEAIKKNAEILTRLLHKSMQRTSFKRELRRTLYQVYLKGTGIASIPWEKEQIELQMLKRGDGDKKKLEKKIVNIMDLPGFDTIEIDRVWVDPNIEKLDDQHGIFIKAPMQWNQLWNDSEAKKIILPSKDNEKLRETLEGYRETVASMYNTHKQDQASNADREYIDRQKGMFKHWEIWIMLPLDPETGTWDVNKQEHRYRVRILGDPLSCEILEIRRNPFPDGVPLLKTNHGEDDIGFYHISLGEKCASYYDQICTAVNQMIDNRSKNTRKPFLYDPMKINKDQIDWGHSIAIPCDGDPKDALYEFQIADMTGSIGATISWNKEEMREIMNTTDSVMGVAMGGRTSASEYQGARIAATTPIFADMAAIEEDLVAGYMRKFSNYVNNYMTPKEIAKIIGPDGMEFSFEFAGHYIPVVKAVQELSDKSMMQQFYLQLYQMVTDEQKKNRILLRMAETMDIDNPHELIPETAQDQAIKAALWENTAILQYAQFDVPQRGENHEAHLRIHYAALWKAQTDKNANANILGQHINQTESLKREEKVSGGSVPLSGFGQPQTGGPSDTSPGEQSGQQISAALGAQQGGTPVPS